MSSQADGDKPEPKKADPVALGCTFAIICLLIIGVVAFRVYQNGMEQAFPPAVDAPSGLPPTPVTRGAELADKNGTIQESSQLRIVNDHAIVPGATVEAGARAYCIGASEAGIKVRIDSGAYKGDEGFIDPAAFRADPPP